MSAFRSGFCCISEHDRCPHKISVVVTTPPKVDGDHLVLAEYELTHPCECECHTRSDTPVAV
jgi:hypothetical protein